MNFILSNYGALISAIGLAVSLIGLGVAEAEKSQTRPNVILIFADDLGPGLLGC